MKDVILLIDKEIARLQQVRKLLGSLNKLLAFYPAMIRQADLHLLPCIFLPFSFLSEKQLVELRRHPPSLFYGHYKNAAPRSINGYPFLLEMGMVYEQDAKLLERKFKAVVAATQEALKA